MSLTFITLFSVTVFIASIIPGPSMLLALTHGMRYGTRKTLASALGNVTTTLVQAGISIAGLGTLLAASQTIFLVIKWAGAGYLIYMGISLLLAPDEAFRPTAKPAEKTKSAPGRLFLQGVLVTAGNPKAIVFFTAVFPQFIDPGKAYFYQSCLLMTIVGIIAFACFMLYALGGRKIVFFFHQTRMLRRIRQIIGATFIGAGIGLAASAR